MLECTDSICMFTRLARVAVPVVAAAALLSACSSSSNPAPTDSTSAGVSAAQAEDAALQYATFVAAWSGLGAVTTPPKDFGVTGVTVKNTMPPYLCFSASDSTGATGTQKTWVLGQYSWLHPQGAAISVVNVNWPKNVTSCDSPGDAGVLLAPANEAAVSGLIGFYSTSTTDTNKPAIDVASEYARVPADRLTQYGKDVFKAYESAMPKYAEEPTSRVLPALGAWLNTANMFAVLPPDGALKRGPVDVKSGTPQTFEIYSGGTATIPEGYSARWGTHGICVDGKAKDGTMMRVTTEMVAQSVDSGGVVTPEPGSC